MRDSTRIHVCQHGNSITRHYQWHLPVSLQAEVQLNVYTVCACFCAKLGNNAPSIYLPLAGKHVHHYKSYIIWIIFTLPSRTMYFYTLHLLSYAGAGFFIGDGAGVGKGRQIAGIILDNFARGRRRHIWMSTSSDLHHDAERDLCSLDCYLNIINTCQTLDRETRVTGLAKDMQEGVLFM